MLPGSSRILREGLIEPLRASIRIPASFITGEGRVSRRSSGVPSRALAGNRPGDGRLAGIQGFTLLEVMVALAIVSVGILGVSRAMSGHVGSLTGLEQRMYGTWVAANRLEMLRIGRVPPVSGENHGSEEMAGTTWYYREVIRETADPALYRVDVRVYLDEATEDQVADLHGYLSMP